MGKRHRHKHHKSRLVIWLEFIPFILFWHAIRLLPLKIIARLNGRLLNLWFMIDRRHHRRTVDHLLHAGITTERQTAEHLAAETYRHLGRLAAEVFKADQEFKHRDIHDILQLEGNREAIRMITAGEPVIIVTAHYGNWEMAASGYCILSGKPLLSVMRPFSNPLIGRYILKNRDRELHRSVGKNGALRALLKELKKGGSVALLADQHASSSEGVETTFFGQPARTHASPAILHLRTGVPILVQVTRRLDDGFHFKSYLKAPIRYRPTKDKEADIRAIAQLYTTALEELIRQEPEQWLWLHRRWLNINRKTRFNGVS